MVYIYVYNLSLSPATLLFELGNSNTWIVLLGGKITDDILVYEFGEISQYYKTEMKI